MLCSARFPAIAGPIVPRTVSSSGSNRPGWQVAIGICVLVLRLEEQNRLFGTSAVADKVELLFAYRGREAASQFAVAGAHASAFGPVMFGPFGSSQFG